MTDLLDRDRLVSKGEFAAELGVTAGRVSQLIGAGQIYGAALVGDGRLAKINVRVASEQLRRTLDLSQRFGANGRADLSAGDIESAPPVDFPPKRNVDTEYQEERLRQIRYANRKADEAERERRGFYVAASDAKRDMGKIATRMLNIFEGAMPDLASAIAAQFGVPQRDALHLLRTEFRGLRARGEAQARAEAAGLPQLVEDLTAEDA